jgi:hypothetical protein
MWPRKAGGESLDEVTSGGGGGRFQGGSDIQLQIIIIEESLYCSVADPGSGGFFDPWIADPKLIFLGLSDIFWVKSSLIL